MSIAQKYRFNKLAKLIYKNTPKFINDIIFSLFGIIKYFEYLRLKKVYLPELKINEQKSRLEISQLQEKKLKKLIVHAYENTEYYKKIIDDIDVDPYSFNLKDLNKFPLLTKDLLSSNKNKIIASNHKRFKPVQQSSGGTTGQTIDFLMDRKNYLYKETEIILYWERHGYIPKESKAVMYRAGVLFPNIDKIPKKPWRNDYGRNLLYISSYYSSDDYYYKYYQKLKEWKPEFMFVLPSAGYLFANYLIENNLKLNIKKIFSASEMLYPSHKKAMENAFNCVVLDHYGHGEPGIYAAGQCKANNYHICESNTIVEKLTDGSLVETSLNNYSMPFIRYKVGDKIESIGFGDCHCGINSKYMTSVIGRDSEIIYTKDGRVISSIGFDQIFKKNNIKMAQIIQKNKGELNLNIVPNINFNIKNKKSMLLELSNRVGKSTIVNFNTVENIPSEKNGKYRLIISKIKK